MSISLFESEIYRELLRDDEIARCFSDTAEIASWLRAEAALAKSQGGLGIIPPQSARVIEQACAGAAIEPASLAAGSGRDGIPLPAFVAALRDAIGDDEHAAWVHFGATSQDIMDTGLVLRLREVFAIIDARLQFVLQALADIADEHAELPLAARTRRQPATPTSFGAIASAWAAPLLAALESLPRLRPRLLRASLYGASGNSAALGPRAAELRQSFAAELELEADETCWHSDRSALAEFASWLTRICGALAKIGEDCLLGSAPEVGELKLAGGGASSTMPQKKNPVQAEMLLTLFEYSAALDGAQTRALLHRQQRDGAAWTLELLTLPQLCLCCGRALQLATALLARLEPDPERMLANLEGTHALVYAEAISFRLAAEMPRPEAQAAVKQLCAEALAVDSRLTDLAAARYPQIDWEKVVDPAAGLGDAPTRARAFAARVRSA